VVSERLDYWIGNDRVDPSSPELFSLRQRWYAEKFRPDAVHPPQLLATASEKRSGDRFPNSYATGAIE
jgi:hypothetical protein